MSRLATICMAAFLGLLCVGASGQAALPPLGKTVITIEVCKWAKSGVRCGPNLDGRAPHVGYVSAPHPKIDCPQDCMAIFKGRANVTMTATPITDATGNYRFKKWDGICAGEPKLCKRTVARNAEVHVRAFFTFKKQYGR